MKTKSKKWNLLFVIPLLFILFFSFTMVKGMVEKDEDTKCLASIGEANTGICIVDSNGNKCATPADPDTKTNCSGTYIPTPPAPPELPD